MLRARLHCAGRERDALIVDVSSQGLAATADNPPRPGDYVELVVGDIVLTGQVKWADMRRFGMAFRERISVDGLLSGGGVSSRPDRPEPTPERVKDNRGLLLMMAGSLAVVVLAAVVSFAIGTGAGGALVALGEAEAAMMGRF